MLAGHFQNIFFDYGEKYSMRFVRAERDKVRPRQTVLLATAVVVGSCGCSGGWAWQLQRHAGR